MNSPEYISDGTIEAGIWKRARIPIADLQITNATFTRLSIMDNIGSSQPRLYIDDILLIPPEPGPHIISAAANGVAGVIVFFDKELNEYTATAPTNYGLTSADDPNYATAQQPTIAGYNISIRSVILSFAQNFIDGATYVLTVNNVEDTQGDVIAPDSTVSFIVGILSVNYDAALILQYVVGLISEFPVASMMAAEKATPCNYTLNIPDQSVRAGESIVVPVEINEASVLAGGMTLRYDSSVLRATNVGSEMSGAYWESNITEDKIKYAFARIKPSESGAANLFYVKFDVLSNRPGTTTEIKFDHVQLAESLSAEGFGFSDNTAIATHNGSITILPEKSALLQNYPNPFNPETWLPYQLAQGASVIIRIYNIKGSFIRTLHLGNQKAGVYMTKDKAGYWDGRDRLGQSVASGVYFYTLKAGKFRATRRMLIVK